MAKVKTIMIFGLLLFFATACQKNGSREARVEKCYGRITTANGITDRLELRVEFFSDSISGRLDWLPQEKDRQRGTVKGTQVSDDKYSVYYDYTAEGVKNTEKQTIVFEKNNAIITREHDSSDGGDTFLSTDTLRSVPCSGDAQRN